MTQLQLLVPTAIVLVCCATSSGAQRQLHIDQVQDLPPVASLNGDLPPWAFPLVNEAPLVGEDITEDGVDAASSTGQVVASDEEVTEDSGPTQPCPNDPNLRGFVSWSDLVEEIKKTNRNDWKEPYYLCPNVRFDATDVELHIKHYFTEVLCAGINCVVFNADVKIDKNLKGIKFEGVEFAALASPIVVGANTHALFSRCTIRDSTFMVPGMAPLISFGHTFVQTSGFINNVGHGGAILGAEHTLHVDKSAFINNTAQSWDNSGAAIQVGETDRSMAAIIVTDSCFDVNAGASVMRVTEKSYVSLTEGNTILSDSSLPIICEGSYHLFNATDGTCSDFEGIGTSCQALFESLTAISSSEESDANYPGNVDDPSRPFETDPKDWEQDGSGPLSGDLGESGSVSYSSLAAAVLTALTLLCFGSFQT